MVMVRLPKVLCIGGREYSIVFLESLEDEGLAGAHNPRMRRIELNPLRPKINWQGSLLHEIVHAIDNVFGNRHLSEDDINSMAEGLLQVMKQMGIEFVWSEIEK